MTAVRIHQGTECSGESHVVRRYRTFYPVGLAGEMAQKLIEAKAVSFPAFDTCIRPWTRWIQMVSRIVLRTVYSFALFVADSRRLSYEIFRLLFTAAADFSRSCRNACVNNRWTILLARRDTKCTLLRRANAPHV